MNDDDFESQITEELASATLMPKRGRGRPPKMFPNPFKKKKPEVDEDIPIPKEDDERDIEQEEFKSEDEEDIDPKKFENEDDDDGNKGIKPIPQPNNVQMTQPQNQMPQKEIEQEKETIEEILVVPEIPQQPVRVHETDKGQVIFLTPNEALTECLRILRKFEKWQEETTK